MLEESAFVQFKKIFAHFFKRILGIGEKVGVQLYVTIRKSDPEIRFDKAIHDAPPTFINKLYECQFKRMPINPKYDASIFIHQPRY